MSSSVDETAIRTLIEDWAAAVRRKDMDAILRDHAPDVVMFDVPPPLESRGIEAYKGTWALFFAWSRAPVMFDIKRMEIFAGGEVAFAVALMRCSAKASDGEDTDLDFRLTVGLHKIAGRWTVVHEHHSIPADSSGLSLPSVLSKRGHPPLRELPAGAGRGAALLIRARERRLPCLRSR